MLDSDSNWVKISVSDMSDMQPGDVGIYSDSARNPPYKHSNIYAGDSKFWDAGTDAKVKGKGPTSNSLPNYVFRYNK